jgi:hypothetical protein
MFPRGMGRPETIWHQAAQFHYRSSIDTHPRLIIYYPGEGTFRATVEGCRAGSPGCGCRRARSSIGVWQRMRNRRLVLICGIDRSTGDNLFPGPRMIINEGWVSFGNGREPLLGKILMRAYKEQGI